MAALRGGSAAGRQRCAGRSKHRTERGVDSWQMSGDRRMNELLEGVDRLSKRHVPVLVRQQFVDGGHIALGPGLEAGPARF